MVNNQGGGGGRASYATATLPQAWMNTNVLYHLIAMLLVKLYIKSKFPEFDSNQGAAEIERYHIVAALNVGIVLVNAGLTLITASPTIHEVLGRLFECWSHQGMNGVAAAGAAAVGPYDNHVTTIKEWSLGVGAPDSTAIEVQCLAADLFVLRPNIEHYMLAVIFGRGSGPEELGTTFWGQTELSCYDDSQHGIWGMSYKYHERAIVINERNLIRIFDLCFDSYCGGNDALILRWTANNTDQFRRQTHNLTTAYSGPSMVVMALQRHKNVFESFPNPLVWHPHVPHPSRIKAHPDKGGVPADMQPHCPFASYAGNELMHQVYSMYYGALGLQQWASLATQLDPGHLAYANESSSYWTVYKFLPM